MSEILSNVVFDENELLDDRILTGWFPMYVFAWKEGNKFETSKPFNPLFRVFQQAEEFVGHHPNGETIPAKNMPGKVLKGKGIWITPSPKDSAEKAKNRDWMHFFNSLNGFEVPTNKNGQQVLFIPDEYEVLGYPVMGQVTLVPHKEDRDKPYDDQRKYPTVTAFKKLEDFERVDPDQVLDEYDQWSKDTPY